MEIGKQNDIRWVLKVCQFRHPSVGVSHQVKSNFNSILASKSKRQKLRHEYDSVSIILFIGLVNLATPILFLHTCPSPTPSPINCMDNGKFFLHTFLGSQPTWRVPNKETLYMR